MAYKKWLVAAADKNKAASLAETCDTDPFLTLIALSRGYDTPEELEMFFSPEPILSSPYELPDIAKAAEAINGAIERGKKIAIFGDYDCDGITSTALFYSYLKKRNADVIYYLPDRFSDGYGMNSAAIDALKEKGVELIITVDNGIAAVEEVEYAKSVGIETIVTDHHLPSEKLPDALAVVDPHLKSSGCEFPDISGVMVAFKVVCALENCEPEELLSEYADLLAIGLVADVMPLKDENRCAVKEGIKAINNTKKMGLIALLNSASIGRGEVNAGRVAFGIAPRLNAVGRMSSPIPALELLLCDDFGKANELAALIEEQNRQRHTEEHGVYCEAVELIEKNGYNYHSVMVVSGDNWHHGVLGIAAARLTERYGKPTILLSLEDGIASGSGRSLEGFSLYDALKHSEDLLIKFGGHKQAAGVTLSAENVDLLREALNEYAKTLPPVIPTLKLDCKLNISAVTLDLAEALEDLEPYGMGNPSPVFGLYNLEITRISELSGGKHTKLILSKGGSSIQVMLFSVPTASFPFVMGDMVDVAVTLSVNEYGGNRNVTVRATAIRKSGVDEDKFFSELRLYDAFRCGERLEFPTVTRSEIGNIYRAIEGTVSEQLIIQRFIGNLGFFKTSVAIDILEELGLITGKKTDNVKYLKQVPDKKANLENSDILKRLGGGING